MDVITYPCWDAFDKRKAHIPESKVYGANMGPTRVLAAPGGPHMGPINLVIRVASTCYMSFFQQCYYDCCNNHNTGARWVCVILLLSYVACIVVPPAQMNIWCLAAANWQAMTSQLGKVKHQVWAHQWWRSKVVVIYIYIYIYMYMYIFKDSRWRICW